MPRSLPEPTEQLHFKRDGEVLVKAITLRRLRMYHDATVPYIPRVTAWCLVAGETVLKTKDVIGIRLVIIEMSILAIKGGILVVHDAQHPVFYPKCVFVIVIHLLPCNLNIPSFQVF